MINMQAMAHPIIWKGGRVFSVRLGSNVQHSKAHVSISNHQSVGVHEITTRYDHWLMVQSNHLIKRFNGVGVQSNIYGFFGIGVHHLLKTQPMIMHLGGQFDWETRRYLFMANYHELFSGPFSNTTTHNVKMGEIRLGIAPYIGDYDDIHTWLMLQLTSYHDYRTSTASVMPVIRLFKGNILVEFGTNLRNDFLITSMIHF